MRRSKIVAAAQRSPFWPGMGDEQRKVFCHGSAKFRVSVTRLGWVRLPLAAGGRRFGLLTMAVLVALACAGVAQASCNPSRNGGVVDNEAGWKKGPTGSTCFSGSQAYIQVYHPYVAGGSSSGANVELYDAGTGSYGVVGWEQNGVLGFVGFSEIVVSGGQFYEDTWTGPSGDPSYKITYTSGNSYFHVFQNGNNYYNYYEPTYGGCSIRQGGFVNDSANQMPGGYEFPVQLTHSEIQHSDGTWYLTDAPTYIQGPSSWYAADKVSSTEVDIWDRACAY